MQRIDATRKLACRAYLLPALMLAGIAALPQTAAAQSGQTPSQQVQTPSFAFRSRSYINPFPQTDRYHLHVIGDGLATGLASGLEEAFAQDGTLKIINSTKPTAGLARPDRSDWAADIEELAKAQPIHIAVIMMGTNDVRNIRTDKGVVHWGEDAWRAAYGEEIDKLIKALKDKSVAIYWVGLPVMANAKTNEAMALINDIVRERTYIDGVKFVDTWNGFTDQLGAFTAYGPDLTGQSKRLRDADGMSFTARGNRKLANYVEIILRRDLAAAKSERNIPLAGNEDEQGRSHPKPGRRKRPAMPAPVPVLPRPMHPRLPAAKFRPPQPPERVRSLRLRAARRWLGRQIRRPAARPPLRRSPPLPAAIRHRGKPSSAISGPA